MIKFIDDNIDEYINGKKLYGNDFPIEKIAEWYRDEARAYQEIVPKEHLDNFNEYEMVTKIFLYDELPKEMFCQKALIFGGGGGTEIIPIVDRLGEIVIIEPGEKFFRDEINGKKVTYKIPEISGRIDYKDNSFDLITCLGALHHIPNVEYIINEFQRVLKPGGYLLIREPITSMNIFTREANRLETTLHERGIPRNILKYFLISAGFKINNESIYEFRPFNFWIKIIREKKLLILIDWWICQMFSFNETYHAKNIFHKFQAGCVAIVAKKREKYITNR